MFKFISKYISNKTLVKNNLYFVRNVTKIESKDTKFDNNYQYLDSNHSKALDLIKSSMKVIDDFVTEEEEKSLMNEIQPYVKRLRYESSHWDDAIHNYRETERLVWTTDNQKVIDRVRGTAFPAGVAPIRTVHILDLAKEGFCGDTIAGISLLSSSVMRLAEEDNKEVFVDVLLKRRSLYIMTDIARYKFTHEILGQEMSKFKGQVVERDRRVSVICRNEPNLSQK